MNQVATLNQVTETPNALAEFLRGLPGVDAVGADQRAASLATRSIKTESKRRAIDLAISMIDLTTLEGADTQGKVKAMCAKARHPDPLNRSAPCGCRLRLPRPSRYRV